MYWLLKEAIRELGKRQKDTGLIREVDRFLGNSCPIPSGSQLQGFLARHVATAREEDVQFERRCEKAGLTPVVLTYVGDRFLTFNPVKAKLTWAMVSFGYGKRGGPRFRILRLVERKNLNSLNGFPISVIKTR